MLGGSEDLPLRVSHRFLAAPLNALDGDAALVRNGIAADHGQTLIAITAMGGAEDLDVVSLGGGVKEFPKVFHDGVMKPGVDIINEEDAVCGLNQEECQPQHAPATVAHAADGDSILRVLEPHEEAAAGEVTRQGRGPPQPP